MGKVLIGNEYKKFFNKFKVEHERHWVKVAKVIRDIQEFKQWKYFKNEDYEDFMYNFLWYEQTNDKKMIKALEYLENNHPELLEENNKEYLPPYKYIEYIYKYELTEEQTKEMDRRVLAGWNKRELLDLLNEFVDINTPEGEKIRLKKMKIKRLAKNMEEELTELPQLHNIGQTQYTIIQKALNYVKSLISECLSKL